MKIPKESPLEKFRLDYLDAEYDMENYLKREMTEKESNNLFVNFLRRKMDMPFFFNGNKNKAVFTNSTTDVVKRVKQVNKFKGTKKKRK